MTTHLPNPQTVNDELVGFAASVLLEGTTKGSYSPIFPINTIIADNGRLLPHKIRALESLIGPPDLYAGGLTGLQIRWCRGTRMLSLIAEHTEVRLMLHELSTPCIPGSSPLEPTRGVPSDGDLPHLWKIERNPTRAAHSAAPAANWQQLESSLSALLGVWAEQLPLLFGSEETAEVAFDLVNHADSDRRLVVLQSEDHGLLILLADLPGPAPQADALTMISRGWHRLIPLLRAWEAAFEPSPLSATAAARLVVNELRHRGALSPGDISLSNLSRTKHGYLSVPGLAVAQHGERT